MNVRKFDGKGENYSKYRPTYPKEFIDYINSIDGLDDKSIIADIGSGTGILSKQLLGIGKSIIAVEPNADMRRFAESILGNFENFISVNATAENTTLCDRSVDLITVAQAFHWFDKDKFKEECKRILKPGGKVILVWNTRVLSDESMVEYEKIIRQYCPDFEGFSGRKCSSLYNEIGVEGEDEFKMFFEGTYEEKSYQNDQINSLERFIGGALSASYAPNENDDIYTAFVTDLKACFNKYAVNESMVMPFITKSYFGSVK